ncbi:CU044_5270 family protein [Streptomyces sp. S6]
MSRKPSRPSEAERAEMARLLPVPADRDLLPGRQRLLKDYLMTEIQQDTAAPSPSRRPRRRLALVAVPLAAGAVAVAVAIGGLPGQENTPAAGRETGSSGPAAPTSGEAVQLLNRIATVAAGKPISTVRDDQYVYIKSLETYVTTSDDDPVGAHSTPEKPHMREVWLSVDGSRPGLLRGNGLLPGTNPTLDPDPNPKLNSPTYRYLESLPTDPDLLLKKIYEETKGHGPSPDEEAFVTIGDALGEQMAPPKVSAALYQAAARIPGVTVVKDAVDAVGRHGVAVAFLGAGNIRTEWIFDKKTLVMLGERSVTIKNVPGDKAGEMDGATAILERAIVDEVGQAPATAAN